MSPEAPAQPLIQHDRDLVALAARLGEAPLVALDTEFIRESTYYPELCLIQIATDSAVAGIDCLAGLDLEPLFASLLRPDCTWVLHSARQDLEVISNRAGRLPGRLLDTQIAGALIGFKPQLGLQGLLEAVLDVHLAKTHTRADWSRRPLPGPVLEYALDDVRYLLPAWRKLEERLAALGRSSWFEEDCRRQLELPVVSEPLALFERLRGTGGLAPEAQAAALSLIEWRETDAQRLNRPRRWVLGDEELLALATARPRSRTDLERVAGLPRKLAGRAGEALLEAIARAETEQYRGPVAQLADTKRPDKAVTKRLQAALKSVAARLGLEPEVIATRRDLNALAVGRPVAEIGSGWRTAYLAELAAAVS